MANSSWCSPRAPSGPPPPRFYDLFRVPDGKVAEHWAVVFPIPDQLPHTNGLF